MYYPDILLALVLYAGHIFLEYSIQLIKNTAQCKSTRRNVHMTHYDIQPSFESSAFIKILSLSEITEKSSSPHNINSHIKSFLTKYDT